MAAPKKEYTLTDIAEQIGRGRVTVYYQVENLGMGRRVGSYGKPGSTKRGMVLLTAAEVKQLKGIIKPRPRK